MRMELELELKAIGCMDGKIKCHSIRNGSMSGIISYMFLSIHDGKKEMLHAYLHMDRYRLVRQTLATTKGSQSQFQSRTQDYGTRGVWSFDRGRSCPDHSLPGAGFISS